MILIAHRGNIKGPNPERENAPDYISEALKAGFDVEIDLWYMDDGSYMLGHDGPEHSVEFDFLLQRGLWVHCKNYRTLQHVIRLNRGINYFYHTDEDYVLTGRGFIWAYPDQPGDDLTICVMPEWKGSSPEGFMGVCSDFVEKYHD
ncbi:MAG: hypothetical protein ACQ9ET_02905 [Nitrosomonadaceae bacterium]